MTTRAKLPQHVLDTRYLQKLSERILPPECQPSTGEEGQEAATKTVRCDLADAAAKRYCDCDVDERGEEGSDEDSDGLWKGIYKDSDGLWKGFDEDSGWFCSYRSIMDEYKMHVVLERARLHIEADPSAFSETIYQEILERCNFEHTKILEARARERRYSDDQRQTSPPPSSPCGFSPFSLQHLPSEIVVEIASLAQVANPHAHITLSHVDASLRAVVNSTPLLWSRIDFLYPLNTVYCYLKHSADVRLRVTALPPLNVGSAYNPLLQDVRKDENNRLKAFLRALLPHRHRILSLRLRSDDLMFDVSGEHEEQTPAYDFLWNGFYGRVGAARELRLHGSWTADYLPLFSLSLKSLVITGDRALFSKIFHALQAAPRLISLTLCDMSFAGIGDQKGSVLNLDHLESLSLIRTFASAADALFSCITSANSSSFLFPNRRFDIST
ncbi:hypothetical protein M407DRAFT_23235 [Tulasnella calospora MUT 4182]|uniref:F-box domain-containing protein n=1 Tax=Tulasnella calospora MUT 4182 TaxID=1051891 RepID=A0A0C3QLL6_9AGAM|nr:hypothetical protein M407DRAFT_23235 [Tulasnella calospora MUT 4182]